MDPRMRHYKIKSNMSSTVRELYEYLIGEKNWNPNYTTNLFNYLRESIHSILHWNNNSLYRESETNEKHIIMDNMISDVLEKIIADPRILEYNSTTEKFNDEDLKTIMQGIHEDAAVRPDPESAEEYLRAKKLNKARPGELAGNYKGGKRSKNNKKKSKRKHQHNKKSHKKRR